MQSSLPASAKRQQRLVAVTQRALQQWWQRRAPGGVPHPAEVIPVAAALSPRDSVIGSLPRRQTVVYSPTDVSPPLMRFLTFTPSLAQTVGRLLVWCYALAFFYGGILWDRVRGNNTEVRRAVRLRRAFEKAGGTLLKIGQQLAMRIDLLPWSYSVDLSKLQDRLPPFPLEQAITAIEQAAGKPLADIFAVFDPEPIGSASIACIYQARLKNGTLVAVKVRRPHIGEVFVADCRILQWLLAVIEFLTLLRPELLHHLRRDFRDTLLEELDFVKEARYQDIFRRYARKKRSGKNFFTAPRVYFALSNETVMVQEFVSGVWLWEVLAAVERQDAAACALLHRLNIDPDIVARRLLWVNNWGMYSNLLFHADPHPANIVVQPDNRLVFIDFGSVGSLSHSKRQAIQHIHSRVARQDAEGMAQATLPLLEPLPPIDVSQFLKEIEGEYLQTLYVINSTNVAWWEHTSARQWLGLTRMAQKHHVTMHTDTLRAVRTMLLFETIAARLSPQIDVYTHFDRFMGGVARQARHRLQQRLHSTLVHGPRDSTYLGLEQALDTGRRLVYNVQRAIATPALHFSSLVGKSVFVASTVILLVSRVLLLTALAGLLTAGYTLVYTGPPVNLRDSFQHVITHWGYHTVLLLLTVVSVRRMLFRLGDKEI